MRKAVHPLSKGTSIYIFTGVGFTKHRIVNIRDIESYLYEVAPESRQSGQKKRKKKSETGLLIQIRLHPTLQINAEANIQNYSNWALASDIERSQNDAQPAA